MSRLLVIVGGLLVLAGLLWPWLRHLPLGRLPGDICIHREHYHLYVPITTSVVLSLLLSLLFWLFRK